MAGDLEVINPHQASAFNIHNLLIQNALLQGQLVALGLVRLNFRDIHLQGDARPEAGNHFGVNQAQFRSRFAQFQRGHRCNLFLGTIHQDVIQQANNMAERIPNLLIK